MSNQKDVRDLVNKLEAQGWRVEKRRANHYCAYSPDGEHQVFMPSTPSEWRSVSNSRSQLRRAGARV